MSIRAISNTERGQARWPYRDSLARLADALGLQDGASGIPRSRSRRPPGGTEAADDKPRPAVNVQLLPRQLPAMVRAFTGRERELAALTSLVLPDADHAAGVMISVISGTAGVGKHSSLIRLRPGESRYG
jgi:hypothetical protein